MIFWVRFYLPLINLILFRMKLSGVTILAMMSVILVVTGKPARTGEAEELLDLVEDWEKDQKNSSDSKPEPLNDRLDKIEEMLVKLMDYSVANDDHMVEMDKKDNEEFAKSWDDLMAKFSSLEGHITEMKKDLAKIIHHTQA